MFWFKNNRDITKSEDNPIPDIHLKVICEISMQGIDRDYKKSFSVVDTQIDSTECFK